MDNVLVLGSSASDRILGEVMSSPITARALGFKTKCLYCKIYAAQCANILNMILSTRNMVGYDLFSHSRMFRDYNSRETPVDA